MNDLIVQEGDPVLRIKASPIIKTKITSSRIQNILSHMQNVLSGEKHGVALAAPQIGESLRMFIVSGSIFPHESPDLMFINPTITKRSKETETLEEGCLSVRGKQGTISRAKEVTLEALDENGKEVTMTATGLLSQIFQHETDHLDGVLYIDSAETLYDIEDSL